MLLCAFVLCLLFFFVENFIFPAKMGRCMHRSIFVNMVCCGQLNILFYYNCMWRIPQRRIHFSKDFSTIVVSLVSVNIWQCQCNGDVYKHLLKYIRLKKSNSKITWWLEYSFNKFVWEFWMNRSIFKSILSFGQHSWQTQSWRHFHHYD